MARRVYRKISLKQSGNDEALKMFGREIRKKQKRSYLMADDYGKYVFGGAVLLSLLAGMVGSMGVALVALLGVVYAYLSSGGRMKNHLETIAFGIIGLALLTGSFTALSATIVGISAIMQSIGILFVVVAVSSIVFNKILK